MTSKRINYSKLLLLFGFIAMTASKGPHAQAGKISQLCAEARYKFEKPDVRLRLISKLEDEAKWAREKSDLNLKRYGTRTPTAKQIKDFRIKRRQLQKEASMAASRKEAHNEIVAEVYIKVLNRRIQAIEKAGKTPPPYLKALLEKTKQGFLSQSAKIRIKKLIRDTRKSGNDTLARILEESLRVRVKKHKQYLYGDGPAVYQRVIEPLSPSEVATLTRYTEVTGKFTKDARKIGVEDANRILKDINFKNRNRTPGSDLVGRPLLISGGPKQLRYDQVTIPGRAKVILVYYQDGDQTIAVRMGERSAMFNEVTKQFSKGRGFPPEKKKWNKKDFPSKAELAEAKANRTTPEVKEMAVSNPQRSAKAGVTAESLEVKSFAPVAYDISNVLVFDNVAAIGSSQTKLEKAVEDVLFGGADSKASSALSHPGASTASKIEDKAVDAVQPVPPKKKIVRIHKKRLAEMDAAAEAGGLPKPKSQAGVALQKMIFVAEDPFRYIDQLKPITQERIMVYWIQESAKNGIRLPDETSEVGQKMKKLYQRMFDQKSEVYEEFVQGLNKADEVTEKGAETAGKAKKKKTTAKKKAKKKTTKKKASKKAALTRPRLKDITSNAETAAGRFEDAARELSKVIQDPSRWDEINELSDLSFRFAAPFWILEHHRKSKALPPLGDDLFKRLRKEMVEMINQSDSYDWGFVTIDARSELFKLFKKHRIQLPEITDEKFAEAMKALRRAKAAAKKAKLK